MSLFRAGEEPSVAARYQPLSREPLDRIPADANLATSGMPELAGALAVIGMGVGQHGWRVSFTPSGTGRVGALTITPPGQPASATYFSANPRAIAQLALAGTSTAAGDVVMIHSTGVPEARTRSPGALYGRTGRARARDVDMADLLKTSRDLDELASRFRHAAVL